MANSGLNHLLEHCVLSEGGVPYRPGREIENSANSTEGKREVLKWRSSNNSQRMKPGDTLQWAVWGAPYNIFVTWSVRPTLTGFNIGTVRLEPIAVESVNPGWQSTGTVNLPSHHYQH